jgi:hypothetical protein
MAQSQHPPVPVRRIREPLIVNLGGLVNKSWGLLLHQEGQSQIGFLALLRMFQPTAFIPYVKHSKQARQ